MCGVEGADDFGQIVASEATHVEGSNGQSAVQYSRSFIAKLGACE